jgi:hypothetical protein
MDETVKMILKTYRAFYARLSESANGFQGYVAMVAAILTLTLYTRTKESE